MSSPVYSNPPTTRECCTAENYRKTLRISISLLMLALSITVVAINSLGIQGFVSSQALGAVNLGIYAVIGLISLSVNAKFHNIIAVVASIMVILSALTIPGYIPVKVASCLSISCYVLIWPIVPSKEYATWTECLCHKRKKKSLEDQAGAQVASFS